MNVAPKPPFTKEVARENLSSLCNITINPRDGGFFLAFVCFTIAYYIFNYL